MKKKLSITINAFLNTFKTVAGMLMSLITFPYVARVLDVKDLGAFDFSSSIVSYASLLAALGIMSYAIREGVKIRNEKDKLCKFTSEIFSINLFSTLVAYCLLGFLILLSTKIQNYRSIIYILSIEIICTTLGVSWICNIFEDFTFITIRTLLFQFLYLALVLIFVRTKENFYLYIWLTCFASCGGNLCNFFYIRKKYVKFHVTFHMNLRKHLKPILIIFSTKIAISIYLNSDRTILGFLMTDYDVGLYAVSVKICSMVKEALGAVTAVLIPKFVLMFEEKDDRAVYKAFSTVISRISLIVIPAMIGLFVLSKEVILIVAGGKYVNATASLKILCLTIVISMYSSILSSCVLVPKRKEKKVFIATAISAIANIVTNFLLIPLLGINGAATTTVMAELMVLVLSIHYTKDDVKLVGIRKDIVTIAISSVAIAISCILIRHLVSNVIIRVSVSVVFSVFVYLFMLIILKNPFVYEIMNKWSAIKKKK